MFTQSFARIGLSKHATQLAGDTAIRSERCLPTSNEKEFEQQFSESCGLELFDVAIKFKNAQAKTFRIKGKQLNKWQRSSHNVIKQASIMSAGTLYTFKGSGNSYKVRLLEALLGIQLKHEELDFLADQQHSPEFLKINPRGEVPCLVDGDKTFNDSSSILTWLAGKWGDGGKVDGPSSYWSKDLYEQAQIINWLGPIWRFHQPRHPLLQWSVYGLGNNQRWSQDRLDVFLEEGEIRGNQSLQILDKQLSNNDWLVLARPTIADISVFVYVALAPMGDISLQPYSNILAWIERIKGLPGFFPIEGLDQPLLHVGRWKSAGRSEPRNVVK